MSQNVLDMIVTQLFIWKCEVGILDIDTQLNSLQPKWIEILLYPTNALWKGITLYRLNVTLFKNGQGGVEGD